MIGDAASPDVPPAPVVETTPHLIGASFELLNRSSDEMRRASFYVGLVILGKHRRHCDNRAVRCRNAFRKIQSREDPWLHE